MDTNSITSDAATTVVADNPGSKYPFANASFSRETLAASLQTISELKDLLPNMPDLTPKERQRMSKLGIKTRGFTELAIETAKTDPGILPRSVSLESFLAQDQLLRDLSLMQTHVADLKSKLDDALLLVGNYIFGVSRTVYALTKTPAAQARLQEQKEAMKQRFARKQKKDQSAS